MSAYFRPEVGLEKISFLTRAGDEATHAALRRQLQAKYGAGEDETFNDTETCRKIIEKWKGGADLRVFEFFGYHVGTGFQVRRGSRVARVELKADTRCPGSPDSVYATVPRADAVVHLVVEEER